VDCHAIPCDWLDIAKHRVKRRDGEIVRWYQALRRFPDILATSRPSLFALICAAGRQKHTMTAEEIDAYLVESLGDDDEKDVAWLRDSVDDVAATPMMPGEGAEAFPDAEPETTIADEAEDDPAVVAESDIPPSPETEMPEFLRDLPLVNGSVEYGRPFFSEDALNARLEDIPVGGSLVLWGLDNGIYHAADGYSSTQIRLAHRGGIAALDWYNHAPRKPQDSPAMVLGTALHTAILEPERFETEYACAPSVNLRTNEGKQTLAAFEAECVEQGMTPIKREDFDTVCLMRDSALAYPTVSALLENGVAELSVFWRMENGLLLKVRPDWLGEFVGAPFLLDIKTTDDVLDFGQSVEKYGYHMQAAFYRLVVEKVLGVAVDFAFCAVGKRPDCGRYPVLLGMLDEEDEAEAAFQVNTTLAIMVEGANTPVQGLATLSRPWWAKQADRKRREGVAA
jgi:exodeoxyribonuclease VIII